VVPEELSCDAARGRFMLALFVDLARGDVQSVLLLLDDSVRTLLRRISTFNLRTRRLEYVIFTLLFPHPSPSLSLPFFLPVFPHTYYLFLNLKGEVCTCIKQKSLDKTVFLHLASLPMQCRDCSLLFQRHAVRFRLHTGCCDRCLAFLRPHIVDIHAHVSLCLKGT
jgi:hypothetical protein